EFTPTGPDGVPDDKILEEDILTPVRKFLEDKVNTLPDGTLLKDHILYIVVVHGMPYSGKAVFGIEHGVTSLKRDHGSLASLEQRLGTLYYKWSAFTPPVISFLMNGGPDSEKGVVNHIITSAMRHPMTGNQWNPYLHPDTHSFLSRSRQPFFYDIAPLKRRREVLPKDFFIYAVTRIDGADAEEAKRIIDYSLYATKYLRPEMDCRVRASLAKEGRKTLSDLPERLAQAEEKNLWGGEELKVLGFMTGPKPDSQGLPFLVRPENEANGNCLEKITDWKVSGFYPGGIDRYVKSENGLNLKKAAIWDYISKGVTVSAAGAPASNGGPHITNATFWDNQILMRYLFRGRDLGESLLLSIYYTNWSTSLIGDPLMHVDLRKTVLDTTPPLAKDSLEVRFESDFDKVTAIVGADLADDTVNPEVAVMMIVFRDKDGNEVTGISGLYSKRPWAAVKGLRTDTDYTLKTILIDPYGNRTDIPEMTVRTKTTKYPSSIFRKLFY
ncbi:MAG: hypothetical protein OEV28_10105, partial [Nitrospirota bacterium]|nr:hypothetical protein [Nitrospirota bacterium]